MGLLKEEDKNTLKEQFSSLQKKVKIINFTQEMECQYCKQTRELIEEVASLSDKLEFVSYDFVKDKDKRETYNIPKIPATVILDEDNNDPGIRFYGIPAGYEFATLIEDIMDIGGSGPDLEESTLSALKSLAKPVHIQVFIGLTCPYCPAAVRTAHKFAMASEFITADMVEVQEFPDLAVKYNVSGVPKVVINESTDFVGAQPENAFLKYVLDASQ